MQATFGQILAYQRSVFPVDVDQLPNNGAASVTAYCLGEVILSTAYMLRFPVRIA